MTHEADGSLRIAPGVVLPLDEVEVRVSRSSGPGGQHANVTASRVQAVFDVAASRSLSPEQKALIMGRAGPRVMAVSQDSRSQARNRAQALERLRARLSGALSPPPKRRKTRPPRAADRRRLDAKRRTAERKRGRRPPASDEDAR